MRASLVVLFRLFGYQKWFDYEAQVLIPYISNGPLLWMYPVFGARGASWVLGVSKWSFALLLFLGFWHKRLRIFGALGSCAAFIGTVTIIPFMPDGWAASAGGFPGMTGNVPFLMKDVVLFPHRSTFSSRTSQESQHRPRRPSSSWPVRTGG